MTAETDQSPAEADSRRRGRNWIILGALFGFVALVYVVTMVKLAAN